MIRTILNDKVPSYIQSLTIIQHAEGNPPTFSFIVNVNLINGERPIGCDIATSPFTVASNITSFFERNKFAIGPQFVKDICEHLQIKLDADFRIPREIELIKRLNELIKEYEYIEAYQLLHTIEKFTLPVTRINWFNHPVYNCLDRLLTLSMANSCEVPIGRQIVKTSGSQLDALILIPQTLLKKGCALSAGLFPKAIQDADLKEKRDQQFYDTVIMLINYFEGFPDKNENRLKEGLEKTPFWSLTEPKIIVDLYELELKNFKRGPLLNIDKFNALSDYFINLSKLFKNPKKCLEYLKPIDESLKSIAFESTNLTPSAYLANGSFFSPCPPPTFTGIKKNGLLRTAFIKFFTEMKRKYPEINILSSGSFWDTFGFINSQVADDLVKSGELFWEKRYQVTSNAHGTSHFSQIITMIMAHLSGECPFLLIRQ